MTEKPSALMRIIDRPWFLIAVALFLNFYNVFFLQVGFLTGDDVEQHIPWANFLSESLRYFQLPFWTTYMHSGFPLFAEGQIGALYPLNLLFFGLLPLKLAFNYSVLFHYFLGGMFFFWYVRSIGLSHGPALFASLIFLFGSTQGGLFYNVTSQKVMIWFPLTLYLADRIFKEDEISLAGWLGVVFALQVFAGYLQVAIYSILMTCVYILYFVRKNFLAAIFRFVWALVFFLIVSSPQLLSSLELAQFSPRKNLSEAFAYIGSANPAVFATLFFPGWDGILKLGSGLYIGVVPLFFLIYALMSKKGDKETFFILFFLFTLLLALGKFSPLYVGIVKLTHFHGFRVPTKFLFFASFSLAVLAGFGLEKALQNEKRKEGERNLAKCFGWFSVFSAGALGGMVLANVVLRIGKERIIELGRSYLKNRIYGTDPHPHSLDYYFQKLDVYYQIILAEVSPYSFNTAVSVVIILVSLLFLGYVLKKKIYFQRLKFLLIAVLFLDLFFYGFTSIKFGLRDFSRLDRPSKVIDFLKGDKGLFRIYEFDENPQSADKNFPVFPNFNMYHHLADVGAYSPFVMKDYRDFFSNLGGINDSLVSLRADREQFPKELKILSRFNVKYVLSRSEIQEGKLKEVLREDGVVVYQNRQVFPRAYFVTRYQRAPSGTRIEQIKDQLLDLSDQEILLDDKGRTYPVPERRLFEEVPIDRYEQNEVRIRYNAPENGFLILSDTFYPGWQLRVNGKRQDILRANGFLRAVYLEKGESRLHFKFLPTHFVYTSALSACFLLYLLVLPFLQRT